MAKFSLVDQKKEEGGGGECMGNTSRTNISFSGAAIDKKGASKLTTQKGKPQQQQGGGEHGQQLQQPKGGDSNNQTKEGQEGRGGGWEVPRSWEAAVTLYGKYALFLIMAIQVVWVMIVGEEKVMKRKMVEKRDLPPPITVDHLCK